MLQLIEVWWNWLLLTTLHSSLGLDFDLVIPKSLLFYFSAILMYLCWFASGHFPVCSCRLSHPGHGNTQRLESKQLDLFFFVFENVSPSMIRLWAVNSLEPIRCWSHIKNHCPSLHSSGLLVLGYTCRLTMRLHPFRYTTSCVMNFSCFRKKQTETVIPEVSTRGQNVESESRLYFVFVADSARKKQHQYHWRWNVAPWNQCRQDRNSLSHFMCDIDEKRWLF